jgi:acid stress-induced BolA-like protein IbaG/YrbA
MNNTEIAGMLTAALPDSRISVSGAGGKFEVAVVSPVFDGLNRVKRQQVIYRILDEHIGSGAIHAVSMVLKTPAEAA